MKQTGAVIIFAMLIGIAVFFYWNHRQIESIKKSEAEWTRQHIERVSIEAYRKGQAIADKKFREIEEHSRAKKRWTDENFIYDLERRYGEAKIEGRRADAEELKEQIKERKAKLEREDQELRHKDEQRKIDRLIELKEEEVELLRKNKTAS